MAKIVIAGDAVVVTSSLKLEDIKAVENLKKTAEQLARTETEPARKKEEQEL